MTEHSEDRNAIARDADGNIDETLPDVVKNYLESGATLERIRLDARGKWTHEGLDFENPRIIRLFNRSVNRTEGGTWVLEVGRFTYPIAVDDTGFFVERIDFSVTPPELTLSDETVERLAPETLEYEPPGHLYCKIKEGRFRARFKKRPYYDLADHLVDHDGTIALQIGDELYPLD